MKYRVHIFDNILLVRFTFIFHGNNSSINLILLSIYGISETNLDCLNGVLTVAGY